MIADALAIGRAISATKRIVGPFRNMWRSDIMAKNENVKSAKGVDIRPQRATPAPYDGQKRICGVQPTLLIKSVLARHARAHL